ncbi:nickel-binding protein [Nocardioides sp. SR21]|uniref:nickel-binding protein n=1 Tax=Nocardioides sp. SR21 TaxID=2919501 RepID=UPI001FAA31E9|nr:nickel-binding protein [Nocardioides sp. SR21]
MAEFLVEVYVAHDDRSAAQRISRVAQADDPTDGVRCLRSIFVPEDETCFLLYEAPSATTVADAVRRAGLEPEHISATAP